MAKQHARIPAHRGPQQERAVLAVAVADERCVSLAPLLNRLSVLQPHQSTPDVPHVRVPTEWARAAHWKLFGHKGFAALKVNREQGLPGAW